MPMPRGHVWLRGQPRARHFGVCRHSEKSAQIRCRGARRRAGGRPPSPVLRAEVIEDPAHLERRAAQRREVSPSRGSHRLGAAVPEGQQIFEALALRGQNLGAHTIRLLRLLDRYTHKTVQTITAARMQGLPLFGPADGPPAFPGRSPTWLRWTRRRQVWWRVAS